MIVYYLVFATMILIQFIPFNTQKGIKFKLAFALLLLFLYSAVRVDFGSDYANYELLFEKIKVFGIYYYIRTEIGYGLLNEYLPSYRSLLVLLSLFTCVTLYYYFQRLIPRYYHWLIFLLISLSTVIFFQLTGLRNGISINIFILSIIFIKNRKLIYFIILTLLASTFHLTSIIYMPIAYLVATPRKINKGDMIIWGLAVFILGFLPIDYVVNILGYSDVLLGQYSTYITRLGHSTADRSLLLSGYSLFSFVLTLHVLFKYQHKLTDNNIITLKLALLFIISMFASIIAFRGPMWYVLFYYAGYIIVLQVESNKLIKSLYTLSIIAYTIYSFFYIFLGRESFPYDHYNTIWGQII
jgi:hypothetical protein